MSKLLRVIAISALVFSFAVPAAQADGVDVTRSGHGTMGSHWKLELDREFRIKVDFEVDSIAARAGHTWRIVMRHDGAVFFTDTRRTDHEGEFDVERSVTNRAGADSIRVRAVDQRNGEVITAAASI
jgi:hypothetical protein